MYRMGKSKPCFQPAPFFFIQIHSSVPEAFVTITAEPFSDISRGWLISASLATGCRGCSWQHCENKNLKIPPCGFRRVSLFPSVPPTHSRVCATHPGPNSFPASSSQPTITLPEQQLIGLHIFPIRTFCFVFFSQHGSGSWKSKAKGMNGKHSLPGTLGVRRKPAEGEILKRLRFRLPSSERNEQQTRCLCSPAVFSLHGNRSDVSTRVVQRGMWKDAASHPRAPG